MGGGGVKSLGGMDQDTFAPSDVIHLFVMKIDLDLSVGDPAGAAASDDDEVGEMSDEELFVLPEVDDFLFYACMLNRGVISPWVARSSRGGGL